MTPLQLSQELWKLGLRITTEKRWVEYKTQEFSLYDRNTFPARWSGREYPAYSTEELLEVLPAKLIKNNRDYWFHITFVGMREYSVYYGDILKKKIMLNFEDKSLSDALGLMCKYLLENGYTYNPENGLRKDSK